MIKSIEQLRKLALNPFYKLTEEERQRLANADAELAAMSITIKKDKGTVIVKQKGQINKHGPGIE